MADSNDIRGSAEQMASQAGESAQQAASAAMSKAQEMAGNASKRMDEATTTLGERAKSLAGTLRERGPHDGMLGSATGAVADSLENTGRYLQDEGVMGMAEDVTDLIRRNPIPAVLVGVGIGFMLAKMFRR